MDLGIANVAVITAIAYLVGYIWSTAKGSDNKWIPVVCGITGAVLGVVAFATGMKDFPAKDILTAIAVGVVSGFAATGINQIGKQLIKSDDKKSK